MYIRLFLYLTINLEYQYRNISKIFAISKSNRNIDMVREAYKF